MALIDRAGNFHRTIEYLTMSKIYLGSSNLLEKQLSSDIAALKKGNPFHPVVVLVESNLAGVQLRRSLAGHMGSHCRVRFLTFPDLIDFLCRLHDSTSGEPLPLFAEDWLVALTARQAEQGYFAPVAGRPGFSRALLETFRSLEEAGLDQIISGGADFTEKQAELARLFDFYRVSCRGFLNKTAAVELARRTLSGASPFALYCYGYYRFSPLELTLLAELIERLPVTVYWQETARRFPVSERSMDWYSKRGFQPVELAVPDNQACSNLKLLQRSLFAPAAGSRPSRTADSSLQFICAPDEVREVEEITREIAALAGRGTPFREIAVAVKDPSYADLVENMLAGAGIPVYLAGGIPLARSREGKALLLFIELISSEYARAQVMELAAYVPCNFQALLKTADPVSPAYWDMLTVEAGLIGGRENWLPVLQNFYNKLLNRLKEADPSDPGRAPDDTRDRLKALKQLQLFLEILFTAARAVPLKGSWLEICSALKEFVRQFLMRSPEQQVLLRLLGHLGALDRFPGKVTLQAARDLMGRALQSTTLPRGRFQRDGVNILPITALSGIRFQVVFLPGLIESNYPAPLRLDPLLSEAERDAITGLPSNRTEQLSQDAFSFTLALCAASERAILSWPRVSAAGNRELLPSFYLSRAGELLLGYRPALGQLDRLPGYRRLPGGDHYLERLRAVLDSDFDQAACRQLLPPQRPEHYLARLSPLLARLLEFDLSRRLSDLTPYQGIIKPAGSSRVVSGVGRAVTTLEEYARCPYAYFLTHQLNLNAFEDPAEALGLNPGRRGLLLHRILEQFYRQSRLQGLLPVHRFPAENRALLASVCGRQFTEYAARYPLPVEMLWELQQRELLEVAQALLSWEIDNGEACLPEYLEHPFGMEDGSESRTSFYLLDGERLVLRGRIDRIDRCGEKVRVIDYKSGRKKGRDDSLEGGTALQLPLYLLAAADALGLADLARAEACAYYLAGDGVKPVRFSGHNWPEKEETLHKTLSVILSGILGGLYFPYPGESGENCRYCPYKTVCGPEITGLFHGKSRDPRLADFLSLKEIGGQ
ncbi:MAG: PD-(D/E)XK nuclease family protein [Bacillota bacterium]